MALSANSLVQVSCHNKQHVVYAPPVPLGKRHSQQIQINEDHFSFTVRRIRGVTRALVIDSKGEFAFLDYDEVAYFTKGPYTYAFLLAEDFVHPDNRNFLNFLVGGMLVHLILVLAFGLLPTLVKPTPPKPTKQPAVDVARVKQVLSRVARREAEKRRLIQSSKRASPKPPAPFTQETKADLRNTQSKNSFLPPGFEGMRKRLRPQKAPVVADRPPMKTDSNTTLAIEKYKTPSGLGKRGKGPGGGGRGTGWGAAVSGSGLISLALVERALAKNRDKLSLCYEDLLLNEADIEGKLLFKWDINSAGTVTKISLARSEFKENQFHLCLAQVIRAIRFPPPDGGPVTIRFPFVFGTSGVSLK